MASSVTELALLKLRSGSISPAQRSSLARAKEAMEKFSGKPFTYLRCQQQARSQYSEQQDGESCQHILIVGGWPSIKFHMEQWLPTEENQAFVKELGDLSVGVEWMWHVGIERDLVQAKVLGLVKNGKVSLCRAAIPLNAVQHLAEFVGSSEAAKDQRTDGHARDGCVTGWRLDEGFLAPEQAEKSFRKPDETEELVVVGNLSEDSLQYVKAQSSAWEVFHCEVLNL